MGVPERPVAVGRRLLIGLPAVLALSVAGCDGSPVVVWADIPASPGAEPFEGATIETILDTRLQSRIVERRLRHLGSRLEVLPAGVTWSQHQEFRDGHAAGLGRVRETIPEPDAPVVMAEYAGRDRTLFVIARATDGGRRLVVLTALTEPR